MERLDDAEIRARLATLPGWKRVGNEIGKSFEFRNFPAALDFVAGVGERAEAAGHHPDIDIRYSRVDLRLTTHDAGGLTERDFRLAGAIQELAGKATGGLGGSTPGNPLT